MSEYISRQDIEWHKVLVSDGNGMYHNEQIAYKSQIDDLPSAQPEQRDDYARGYNDAKREIALSGEYERAYQRGKASAQPERHLSAFRVAVIEEIARRDTTDGTVKVFSGREIIDILESVSNQIEQ